MKEATSRLILLHSKGLTAESIASVLRSGEADQNFLNSLAMMLDPPPGKKPRYRLHLVHGAPHKPKGATFDKDRLVREVRAVEASEMSRGEKKAARRAIEERHGVSDRTARNAVREADEMDAIWRRMVDDGLVEE